MEEIGIQDDSMPTSSHHHIIHVPGSWLLLHRKLFVYGLWGLSLTTRLRNFCEQNSLSVYLDSE
jgi:hypothetical protein